MRPRQLLSILSVVGILIVAGCGSGSTRTTSAAQTSTKTCWTAAIRQVASDPADARLAKANGDLLVTTVNAVAASARLPSWLPAYIRPWLNNTSRRCGKL